VLRLRMRGSYLHSSIRLHIMHKNNLTLPPTAFKAKFYRPDKWCFDLVWSPSV
jgi:hypothetical protein